MVSPAMSCRARTLPTTTGSTASRCEGLGCSDRCTMRPPISMSVEVPRWYFTSPEPCTSSGLAALALELGEDRGKGFFTMLTSMFSRPRCAMPMAISLTPRPAARLDHRLQRGDGALAALQAEALGARRTCFAQKASKPSASVSCCRISRLAARVEGASVQGAPSIRRWIQDFWSGSWMCMNSTPIGPQ